MKINKLMTLLAVSATVATPAIAKHHDTQYCLDNIPSYVYMGRLDLSYCGLDDSNMPTIVNFIKAHPEVVEIELANNGFHSKGAKLLATIQIVPTAEGYNGAINLNNNHIGDEGVAAFANIKIDSFEASNNQIGDKGSIAIAKNNSLYGLDLSENHITSQGAAAYAQNASIRSLDLSYNMIGDAGAIALAHNQVINQLFIDGNLIGDTGALAFPKFRPNHGQYFDLRMAYNNIGEDAVNQLIATYNLGDWSLLGNPGAKDPVDQVRKSTQLDLSVKNRLRK